MSTINDLGETYTDAELRDAIATDQAVRANAHKVFGSAAEKVMPSTRTNAGNGALLRYDSSTGQVTANGTPVSVDKLPVERIADNGRYTPGERAEADKRVAWLQKELTDVLGYDNNRQPIYRRADADRALLTKQLEAAKRDRDAVYAEAAALDKQRTLDAQVTADLMQRDADREDRLNAAAVARADELEVDRRARALLAERDRGRGGF